MRLIDIDPIIERLKNAIYLGKRIGEDTANMEAVLADVEAAPTYNDDLISRQSALDAIISGMLTDDDSQFECPSECNSMLEWAVNAVSELPTAEPSATLMKVEVGVDKESLKKAMEEAELTLVAEPRTGEWLDDCGGMACSCCGFSCDDPYYLGEANYCPNCGADMREESE